MIYIPKTAKRAKNPTEGGMTGKNMDEEKMEEVQQQVLEELAQIGFARVPEYLQVENDMLQLRDLQNRDVSGAAIASIEKGTGGWKVKFYDKLKALELLGKHLGMFTTSADREEKAQSNNLLECILQATEGVMDTDDIPEIQQTATSGHELVEPAEP